MIDDYEFLKKEICNLEKEAIRNPKWFYYGLNSNNDNIEDILRYGLKSNILLDKVNEENYRYYIVLTQYVNDYNVSIPYIYNWWLKSRPMLIMHHVNAIKCSEKDYSFFEETIIPLRNSFFQNTHEAFLKVPKSKIVGIELYLCGWLNCYREQILSYYGYANEIINCMKNLGMDYPIYDFSREKEGVVHSLDIEQAQYLCEQVLKRVNER